MKTADEILLREIQGMMERLEIRGISIDSRTILEGELFVAIKGDRFDGHDFVPAVLQKGAWGALVERSVLESGFPRFSGLKNVLPVEDTLYALQEMAYMHRRKFSLPVVGITGSNGKTTTKEMLACILQQKGPVLKTEGNLNNHIGVPLTLLRLDAGHTAAVVEMGMSALGEIDTLARLVGPDIAIITNIGPAHLEFLRTMDNVAQAKSEVLEHLKPGGAAALNVDDRYFETLKKKHRGPVLSFGIDREADVRATDIRQGGDFTDFTLTARGSQAHIRLRTVGKHNLYNALAASAAALATGMPVDAVKNGLDAFLPGSLRSELRKIAGRTVLVDCYNANPVSMEAALRTVISLRSGGTAVAVLGDMLELGNASVEAHRSLGAAAARLGVDVAIIVGSFAKHTLEGAIDAGMARDRVFEAGSHTEAADLLKKHSRSGDAVLIKGSRGMKMEKVLEGF